MGMRVLFLHAEVMGYTMATIRELSLRYEVELHVVHWDKKKLTPYQHPSIVNVSFYGRSCYSTAGLKELALKVNPDLIVCSGWMDKGYLHVAKIFRKNDVPVVAGLDGHWNGTLKQRIAAFFSFYLRRHFSHAWVAGANQFEFARRLGFKNKQVIFDVYSADIDSFNISYERSKLKKENQYPHRFLFVGRFEQVKAVDLLVEAWNRISDERNDWELHFIGNGSMKDYLQQQDFISVKDFMQPETLVDEIAQAGCFVLPSRSEPWGVVIHEFAAAGLPLLCSNVCGANQTFLINGTNGYSFESENVDSLARRMIRIIESSDKELLAMSESSHRLAQRITPSTAAANLISILR